MNCRNHNAIWDSQGGFPTPYPGKTVFLSANQSSSKSPHLIEHSECHCLPLASSSISKLLPKSVWSPAHWETPWPATTSHHSCTGSCELWRAAVLETASLHLWYEPNLKSFSVELLPDSSSSSPPKIHEEGCDTDLKRGWDLNSRHLSNAAEWKNRSSD